MAIKRSIDQGQRWYSLADVWAGASAYSQLVALGNKQLGLLFEAGSPGGNPYDSIVWTTVRTDMPMPPPRPPPPPPPPCLVEKKLSAGACTLNATFGCNTNRTMWVRGGCRGIFNCDGVSDVKCDPCDPGTGSCNPDATCDCA